MQSQVLTLSSGLFVLGCRCVAASAGVSDAIVSYICTPALCRALCDAGRRTEALAIASEIDVNTSQLLEEAGFKSVSTNAANAWHCVGPESSSGVQLILARSQACRSLHALYPDMIPMSFCLVDQPESPAQPKHSEGHFHFLLGF